MLREAANPRPQSISITVPYPSLTQTGLPRVLIKFVVRIEMLALYDYVEYI